METRQCKWCGMLKPIEQFRKYYGGRKGRYTHCKDCERVENRRKYLVGKGDNLTDEHKEELAKINKLYDMRVAAGYTNPREATKPLGVTDELDAMLKEAAEIYSIDNAVAEAGANEEM